MIDPKQLIKDIAYYLNNVDGNSEELSEEACEKLGIHDDMEQAGYAHTLLRECYELIIKLKP